MMFRRLNRVYFEEAGDDGSAGGAGGDDAGTDGSGGNVSGDDVASLKAQLEQMQQLQQENERLQAKIQAANKHQRESERAAKEAARAKAEADGNYEQLFKSSEQERESLTNQLAELQSSIESKEINNAALKIANSISDGPNAEILSRFISERLKFADGSIKVTDEAGNLTVSSLGDLANEFSGSAKFSSLIRGKQSSGGGASGGSSSGGAAKTMMRSDFDALDPVAKSKFMKDGGKLTE